MSGNQDSGTNATGIEVLGTFFLPSIHCGWLNLCPELYSPSEIVTTTGNQKLSSGTCYINFDAVV